MTFYYLLSGLPTPTWAAPPPLKWESFVELIRYHVGPDFFSILSAVNIEPPRDLTSTGYAILDDFWQRETSFRNSLASWRNETLGFQETSSRRFQPSLFLDKASLDLLESIRRAESPLKAELDIERYRWDWLDGRVSAAGYSEEALIIYALKLRILLRVHSFKNEVGRREYNSYYSAVLAKADGLIQRDGTGA